LVSTSPLTVQAVVRNTVPFQQAELPYIFTYTIP